MKNTFYCILLVLFLPNLQAQSKFSIGIETALTLSSMSYHDAPSIGIQNPYKNYYGEWIIANPISGTFGISSNIGLGFNTEYRFNKKIALTNCLSVFGRSLNTEGVSSILYLGVTSLCKFYLSNKLHNLYFLGGFRVDKMMDFRAGNANRILNYFEKQYEISPIIGVGYEVKTLSRLAMSLDLRFNPGFQNLLADAPWQGQNRYNSYAYNQTIWLNLNFWFKKKNKK
jgi:hypothetical protein